MNQFDTIGDLYGPAMEVQTKEEAEAYFKRLIEHYVRHWNKSIDEATSIVKQSLGYFAGYYDQETIERTQRLYGTVHPVFGDAETIKRISGKQVFLMGAGTAALGKSS